MQRENCFYLGYIFKLKGLKGEVSAKLDTDQPHNYSKMGSVFVAFGQQELIPFFISNIRIDHKGMANILFEGVTSIDQAKEMVGGELWLPLDLLPKLTGNKFYYHEIVGFDVLDEIHGNLGKVEKVLDNSSQALIQVGKGRAELLIPVLDQFILAVDRENSVLKVKTPDGLVELYRGPPPENDEDF